MMAIDLLQLDKDCAMPTLLRRKWKEMHGYDPVLTRRTVRYPIFLALLATAVGLVFILTTFICFSVARIISAFIWFGLATIFIARARIKFSQSEKFTRALEKLAIGMPSSWPPEMLYQENWKGLRELAEMNMKIRVRKLLEAERRAKENTDRGLQEELDGDVACRRRELKDSHAALLAFQLVDEKWDRYFALVESELTA